MFSRYFSCQTKRNCLFGHRFQTVLTSVQGKSMSMADDVRSEDNHWRRKHEQSTHCDVFDCCEMKYTRKQGLFSHDISFQNRPLFLELVVTGVQTTSGGVFGQSIRRLHCLHGLCKRLEVSSHVTRMFITLASGLYRKSKRSVQQSVAVRPQRPRGLSGTGSPGRPP